MVTWRESPTDSESATQLLDHYFASRALSFPAEQGVYTPTYPTPAQFVPPAGVFLVVEGENLAGEPADVGCGGIRRLESAGSSVVRFEVKHVWLEPFARGTGAGRALLTELENRAAELGATEVVLDTNASQAAADALYRSAGYEQVDAYNDNPNATHWYRKSLTPEADIRNLLVEAIAAWRIRQPDSQAAREALAQAAATAVALDAPRPGLVDLASAYSDTDAGAIDAMVDQVVDELELQAELSSDPASIAARLVCRMMLTGKIDERDLARWANEQFGHESQVEPIDSLAMRDHEYYEYADYDPASERIAAIDAEVRAIARKIVDRR